MSVHRDRNYVFHKICIGFKRYLKKHSTVWGLLNVGYEYLCCIFSNLFHMFTYRQFAKQITTVTIFFLMKNIFLSFELKHILIITSFWDRQLWNSDWARQTCNDMIFVKGTLEVHFFIEMKQIRWNNNTENANEYPSRQRSDVTE